MRDLRSLPVVLLCCLIAGCGGSGSSGLPIGSVTSPSVATAAPTGGATASPTTAASSLPSPATSTSPTGAASAMPSNAASALPSSSASASPSSVASATPTGAATATAIPNEAVTYTPTNVAGPALDVDSATLAASLSCPTPIANSAQSVILLVPGTDLTPDIDYAWNYERAFTANGMPWCAVTLPYSTTGDIQTAGEYVVNAIRTVYEMSGRKVHVLGHSQGGMVPRWALRFWPDTRAMVDDVVGMAPTNHGTLDSVATGAERVPADWQQASNANFIAALNSYTETFAGINYTDIFSYLDEIATPNTAIDSTSSLSVGPGTISNIALQTICPNDASEHLATGTYDPVAYALVIDAFTHGVASASRIPLTVCTQLFQPGVDPSMFAQNEAAEAAFIANLTNDAPMVNAEPTMAPYVFTDHHG